MMKQLIRRLARASVLIAGVVALSGCGGSANNAKYTVGGSVTGLAPGSNFVLLDNNGNARTISTNGSFPFTAPLPAGSRYMITVGTQPTGQTCSVTGGSGTILRADVTDVIVTCTNRTYTIGGTIQGLNESGLVLVNGSDTLKVAANATSFTMPSAVSYRNTYSVTVQTNPSGLSCSVIDGAGTVPAADVTSISVSCIPDTESVLYSFVGGTTDGASPEGSLIEAASGNYYGMTGDGGANNDGTVFEITAGGTETVLYSFEGGSLDGAHPLGSLIQATDGNFYGTTSGGGAHNVGAVFKITPGGSEALLYSFKGGATDGASPDGSLIQASDGNFYGMTAAGGANNDGTVFEITPGGTETVLYSFKGGATDGASPDGSLIQGTDGSFYGMTRSGGSSGDGCVFEITPGGTETVLHSFNGGTTDGASPEGSLIQAADGSFYGMTYGGGASGDGTVFKITFAGSETVLYSFVGGTANGAKPYDSLVQGSDGNFYGTTGAGAGGNGIVFKITPSGTETVLHLFKGPPTDGAIPLGSLIQASNGNFYGMTVGGGASSGGTVFQLK